VKLERLESVFADAFTAYGGETVMTVFSFLQRGGQEGRDSAIARG
jgi:hypothetical protein